MVTGPRLPWQGLCVPERPVATSYDAISQRFVAWLSDNTRTVVIFKANLSLMAATYHEASKVGPNGVKDGDIDSHIDLDS